MWRLYLDSGEEITARFLVNAAGAFNTPNLPDIAGVDSFDGITMHTARWDHSQDLTGKRVAIIGTGASAVQVIPEIAPESRIAHGVPAHADLVLSQAGRTRYRALHAG